MQKNTVINQVETTNPSFKNLYDNYKRKARLRKLNFELTKKEFEELTSSFCFYCGAKPTQERKNYKNAKISYFYNGIDRKNNLEGYTSSNCVSCCKYCNFAKNIMTEDEFKDWIQRIYKNYILKEIIYEII